MKCQISQLLHEIGGGVETLKKMNFIITFRYEIPMFSSVGPFFEEGGRGSRKFRPEAELGFVQLRSPLSICK